MLHDFDTLIGVEYLKKVYEESLVVLTKCLLGSLCSLLCSLACPAAHVFADESVLLLGRYEKEVRPALEKEQKETRKQSIRYGLGCQALNGSMPSVACVLGCCMAICARSIGGPQPTLSTRPR